MKVSCNTSTSGIIRGVIPRTHEHPQPHLELPPANLALDTAQQVRDFARKIFKGVAGTTIDGSQAIVNFFADRTAIYFNLVSERHVAANR